MPSAPIRRRIAAELADLAREALGDAATIADYLRAARSLGDLIPADEPVAFPVLEVLRAAGQRATTLDRATYAELRRPRPSPKLSYAVSRSPAGFTVDHPLRGLVTVCRSDLGFIVERRDDPQPRRVAPIDYSGLVEAVAGAALTDWRPPRHPMLDGVRGDLLAPLLSEFEPEVQANIRQRTIVRVRRSLGRRVHAAWQDLLGGFPTPIMALHRRMWGIGQLTCRVALEPAFWARPLLVRDVMTHRAAAIAAACPERLLLGKPRPLDRLLDTLASWPGLFSVSGHASRALRRTLAQLPGGVPPSAVLSLARLELDRALTTRLGFLVHVLPRVEIGEVTGIPVLSDRYTGHPNLAVFDRSDEPTLRAALSETRGMLIEAGIEGSPLRAMRTMRAAMAWIFDYPLAYGGDALGLVGRCRQWHQDPRRAMTPSSAVPLDPRTPLPRPPFPLPEDPRVRWLDTVAALTEEGDRMQHCVQSYAPAAVAGRCFLFHIDHEGCAATVEVDAGCRVQQANGPRNRTNVAADWARRYFSTWSRRHRIPPAPPNSDEMTEVVPPIEPAWAPGVMEDIFD